MNRSRLAFLGFALLALGLVGCSKVEYDYKALGFADKAEMEAAFAKGYQTKQKLDEMIKTGVTAMAVPKPIAASSQPISKAEPTGLNANDLAEKIDLSDNQCTSNRDYLLGKANGLKVAPRCADVMLFSARTENLAKANEFAKIIDSWQKPPRGDRKTARKLNQEGLDALARKQYAEAESLFSKARSADPLDEEIVANLVYAYSEAKAYKESEKLAYEALSLNPTRSAFWLPIAIAKKKDGKNDGALQAFWLAWQFTKNREKFASLIDKRIAEETDESIKELFVSGKSWVIGNVKPFR